MPSAMRRAKPRTSAMAMAMPVAADIQLWMASDDHVGEVADGRLRRVALPVGVGGEGGRRVERQVGRHVLAAEVLRVERQDALQPQQRVGEQMPTTLNSSMAKV